MNTRKTIWYVAVISIVVLTAIVTNRPDPRMPTRTEQSSTPYVPEPVDEIPTEASLVVIVFDDTDKRPLPSKAEIWFRGNGSWWLSSGSNRQTLGPRPIGKNLKGDNTVVIYPDGRKSDDTGQRINVPIKLTSDMNPDGSTRDAVTIEISDEKVVAFGLPVKAATGKTSKTYKRE